MTSGAERRLAVVLLLLPALVLGASSVCAGVPTGELEVEVFIHREPEDERAEPERQTDREIAEAEEGTPPSRSRGDEQNEQSDAQSDDQNQDQSDPEDAWVGELAFGGNARLFLFQIVEDVEASREDAEQGALRLTVQHELSASDRDRPFSGVRFEAHGVLSGTSPIGGGFGGSGVTSSGTNGHRRFDLTKEVLSSDLRDEDVRMWAEIDRANVRFEHRRFSLTVGRQPVTWGVNYFWPVIDLFGPFSPAAVDRDYKPGIDAVRFNLPVGAFSEIELIAAAQGDEATAARDSEEDWSWGALGRFHVAGTDVGFVAGSFYRDEMAGAFVTGDAAGFGLRAEVLFTDVADEWQGLPGESRESFWRATLGVDRLLSPNTSLVVELSYSGFGAQTPEGYPTVASSYRVRRGEITSLGREYSGVSLSWQATPLLSVATAVLTNWGDDSTLLQPSLAWSLSDNASALFGAFVGFGNDLDGDLDSDLDSDLDRAGLPGSEYGVVPVTVWGAVKIWF